MSKKVLFWFRQDLRVSDNPGLYEAASTGKTLPIYIVEDAPQAFSRGEASNVWLHHSLLKLNEKLDNHLNVYKGTAQEIILNLVKAHSITDVYWNRCYEPSRISSDTAIKSALKDLGVYCKSMNASMLWEPWTVLKQDATPYKVFTPFYKKGCLSAPSPRDPLPVPKEMSFFSDNHNQLTIQDLNLLPQKKWHESITSHWVFGEDGAEQQLNLFLDRGLNGYKEGRNYPAKNHVSRLSPHIHFGEISPHQLWFSLMTKRQMNDVPSADIDHFQSELAWREFSYYLLYHFPTLPRENFQKKFDSFVWQSNLEYLKAWQKGETGYPIIDAGMRELWQTGYMHNRVRMIVGSFLVKNLLLHWHHGEDWFWDCLVDADLANNSASWQWVAGSGADAAPYFRIFNPVTQSIKFDPEGTYIKRFVPELQQLPTPHLFTPWTAPIDILNKAGVQLGQNYPKPIVDLDTTRKKALEAFAEMKHVVGSIEE